MKAEMGPPPRSRLLSSRRRLPLDVVCGWRSGCLAHPQGAVAGRWPLATGDRRGQEIRHAKKPRRERRGWRLSTGGKAFDRGGGHRRRMTCGRLPVGSETIQDLISPEALEAM